MNKLVLYTMICLHSVTSIILQLHIPPDGRLNIDYKCWTLDNPVASLATFHLDRCVGWQFCQNLVNMVYLTIIGLA